MKNNIQILLDRREEIRKTINKLETEYEAIGTILTKLYQYEKKEKEKIDYDQEL